MKIKRIELKNFKRFTNLTIDMSGCEVLPKLVLLIGANGSGKSAVFDAFEVVSKFESKDFPNKKTKYYLKNKQEQSEIQIEINDNIHKIYISPYKEDFPVHYPPVIPYSLSFYGRSAVRYVSRLTRTNIQAIDITKNSDKPNYYIDQDSRFENDLDTLMYEIMETVFKGINTSDSEFVKDIKSFLSRINDSLKRIFGEGESTSLRLDSFLPPADGVPIQLMFVKGVSEIHYDLLSSGEKEVINILFNLLVRSPHYQNSIYFIDELDAHLHTELQYNLLKEVVENWIPDDSQLWTASHSLGFIHYAQSSEHSAIVDFDNLNFDQSQTLTAKSKDERSVFDIAVPSDMLPYLFKDKEVVFCENTDSKLYNYISLSNKVFLGLHDKKDVFLRILEKSDGVQGIVDRDFLSDGEIQILYGKYTSLYILNYYCIENYLFHPDNIAEYKPGFDTLEYIKRIKEVKNKEKDELIRTLDKNRSSYIFFTKNNILGEQNRSEGFADIKRMLESDDFEEFYKVFSMKKHTNICRIPNVSKSDLAKTKWFRKQIEKVFAKNI